MSGLFASLTMAARALDAQRLALDTVGRNIANAGTPGYSRQEVWFAAIPPAEPWSGGGGVEAVALRAARDLLLEGRIQQERPLEERDRAIVRQLSIIEPVLGTGGVAIGDRLTAFFGAWASLAEDPTSPAARTGVLSEAQSLASAFHDTSRALVEGRMDADSGIRTAVNDVNALAARLAELNRSISMSGGNDGAALQLQDEIGRVIDDLSCLVDIDTIQRQDGGFDVTFGSGRPLVIGGSASLIEVRSSDDGTAELASQGFVVTAEVSGGKIGGLIEVRDNLLPGYLEDLDRIAATLCEQVNALHQSGFDLDGNPGAAFFVPLAAVDGAASAMQVDATVALDPRRVVAAGVPSAGDNQVARALAGLAGERVLDGSATFTEAWGNLVYRTGRDLQTAREDGESRAQVVLQLAALRDAVSGVSLDEEAMMMTRFQRAYEANARYFGVIDSAIQTLLQMVRV